MRININQQQQDIETVLLLLVELEALFSAPPLDTVPDTIDDDIEPNEPNELDESDYEPGEYNSFIDNAIGMLPIDVQSIIRPIINRVSNSPIRIIGLAVIGLGFALYTGKISIPEYATHKISSFMTYSGTVTDQCVDNASNSIPLSIKQEQKTVIKTNPFLN